MYKDEHVSFAVFNTLVSSSIFIRAFINPSLFLVKDTAVASARYSLFLEIIKFKRLAKIGDNIIGVTPRTFYISMSCNGAGVGTGNAW